MTALRSVHSDGLKFICVAQIIHGHTSTEALGVLDAGVILMWTVACREHLAYTPRWPVDYVLACYDAHVFRRSSMKATTPAVVKPATAMNTAYLAKMTSSCTSMGTLQLIRRAHE